MTYEQCVRLKNAGWPQPGRGFIFPGSYWVDDGPTGQKSIQYYYGFWSNFSDSEILAYDPTTDELLDAFRAMKKFVSIELYDTGRCRANILLGDYLQRCADDPKSALVELMMAMPQA